jgi:hypothetical protein
LNPLNLYISSPGFEGTGGGGGGVFAFLTVFGFGGGNGISSILAGGVPVFIFSGGDGGSTISALSGGGGGGGSLGAFCWACVMIPAANRQVRKKTIFFIIIFCLRCHHPFIPYFYPNFYLPFYRYLPIYNIPISNISISQV